MFSVYPDRDNNRYSEPYKAMIKKVFLRKEFKKNRTWGGNIHSPPAGILNIKKSVSKVLLRHKLQKT
jgi:hypothetical protein